MFDSLGPECQRLLKADYNYKTALIKTRPDKYIETLKEEDDLKYIVSTEVLKGAIAENPRLLSQLETLASSGNVVAAVLMTRLSLDKLDGDNFLKYYQACPQSVKGGYFFDKIDSE